MDTESELILGCIIAVAVLNFSLAGFAEDPIVVHYSDPSLARMEAQIGLAPAQKDRFEDIVVEYRELFSDRAAELRYRGNPGRFPLRPKATSDLPKPAAPSRWAG
jgi:hypothetical protein